MSWPWAKRHPMPEPAEFIRQNTTALNPDIVSGTPSPAQVSYPRLPSEFVLPGAGTESFDRNREVSAACQNMTATILAGFPDPDDEFYKTLISGALRIGIEYLLVGGGEQELQWQEVYIFFRNEMPEKKDEGGEKKASDADAEKVEEKPAEKVEENPTGKAEEPETPAVAEEDKTEKQ